MKNRQEAIERIMEVLGNMSRDEVLNVWNEYSATRGGEDTIHPMEMFDEELQDYTPWEVARAAYYSGNFCPAHDYFWLNVYGNLESSDYPESDDESPFDMEVLADYIADGNSLYNDELESVLEELEIVNEEEEE